MDLFGSPIIDYISMLFLAAILGSLLRIGDLLNKIIDNLKGR